MENTAQKGTLKHFLNPQGEILRQGKGWGISVVTSRAGWSIKEVSFFGGGGGGVQRLRTTPQSSAEKAEEACRNCTASKLPTKSSGTNPGACVHICYQNTARTTGKYTDQSAKNLPSGKVDATLKRSHKKMNDRAGLRHSRELGPKKED